MKPFLLPFKRIFRSSSWVFPNGDKWPSVFACSFFRVCSPLDFLLGSLHPSQNSSHHTVVGILVWNCNGRRQRLKSGKTLGKNQTGLAAGSWMGKPRLWSNRSHGADPSKQEETSDLEKGPDPSCLQPGKDGVGQLTSSDLLFTITLKRFWGDPLSPWNGSFSTNPGNVCSRDNKTPSATWVSILIHSGGALKLPPAQSSR